MTTINSTGRSTMPRRLGAGLTLALAMSATACQEANNRFLNVVDPDIIFPNEVLSPEAAVSVAYGAIATFRSTTGADESTWLFGGLLVDEWSTSSTFIQNDETDQRQIQEFNQSITGMLQTVSRTHSRRSGYHGPECRASRRARAHRRDVFGTWVRRDADGLGLLQRGADRQRK